MADASPQLPTNPICVLPIADHWQSILAVIVRLIGEATMRSECIIAQINDQVELGKDERQNGNLARLDRRQKETTEAGEACGIAGRSIVRLGLPSEVTME
jgi:hypothetical protein